LLPAGPGWNRIDIIGRVIQQITSAKELQPTFIVLNPVDWWAIRLTKDTQGRYILGDPMGPVEKQQLFGLTPIVTTSIASGTFLVGSGSPIATEIRDRMGMTVEIATQHGTYFTENMIAIRAEKRLALVTYRPASFITGSFTTSPSGQ
jgi:HK97 family phage major capsid protein